jgi:hypothetical protein
MKMLSTISKNVVIFLVLVHKSITQMIQREYFTIYFKKSLNTRAPPSREVMTVKTFALIRLMQQEIVPSKVMLRTIYLMLIHSWEVLDLRILLWETLICKMVQECQTQTITLTLSSRNCIEDQL